MHIYVGKLSLEQDSQDLRKLFEEFGTVTSANVYRDRFRNDAAALGFVDMPNENEANKAIESLNGRLISGVEIEVHKSRSKDDESKYTEDRRKRT